MVKEVLEFGFWQTEKQMEERLGRNLNKGETCKAIKAQLRFREKILKQPVEDKSLFRFSKDGKLNSVETLKTNVKALMHASQTAVLDPKSAAINENLVGRKIIMKAKDKETEEEKEYHGTIINRVPQFPEWVNILYGDGDIYVEKIQPCIAQGIIKILPQDIV